MLEDSSLYWSAHSPHNIKLFSSSLVEMTHKSHEERLNCNASNPDRDKDPVIRAGDTTIRVENRLKSDDIGFKRAK